MKQNAMQTKVRECFRFFDQGGEGSISWAEFQVMNDIWSEMALTLQEFLWFLTLKVRSNQSISIKAKTVNRILDYVAFINQSISVS